MNRKFHPEEGHKAGLVYLRDFCGSICCVMPLLPYPLQRPYSPHLVTSHGQEGGFSVVNMT